MTRLTAPAATTHVTLAGKTVMPGLVNTHGHAPMVLFRGLADDLALMDWLNKYIFPAEAKTVSPEFVRVGTKLAALEMIQSGTTTYTDMYYFEEEIAKATKEAGLRGVLGETVIQFPVADAKTPADALARTEAYIKAFKGDDLITPAVAPHSMYTLDADTLKATAALGRKYDVPVLIHLAETQDEVNTARKDHSMPVTATASVSVNSAVDPSGKLACCTCSAAATTTACMATVVSNFTPTAVGTTGKGYQSPGACAPDSLWPTWISITLIPAGLVQMPCS